MSSLSCEDAETHETHEININPKVSQDNVSLYTTSGKKASNRHPLLKRLIVLKNLQLRYLQLKSQYYNELFELDSSYEARMHPLCKKRQRVINGSFIPPSLFNKFKTVNFLELSRMQTQKLPYFWLAVLLNSPVIKDMIQPADIPVLEYLSDICVHYHNDKSFTIEFHFDRNDFISNSVLKKRYYQIIAVDNNDPFAYEGPDIYRSEGCEIYWKKTDNIRFEKGQDWSSNGILAEYPTALDIVRSTSFKESFFHFFNPPQFPMEKVVVDMELERILTIDFEIGNFLRKRIIPSAISIYLKVLNQCKKLDRNSHISMRNFS